MAVGVRCAAVRWATERLLFPAKVSTRCTSGANPLGHAPLALKGGPATFSRRTTLALPGIPAGVAPQATTFTVLAQLLPSAGWSAMCR
jgi:hypothetical protein